LNPAEVARVFRARRIGRGKWMAKCPAHRERTGSLSITDMGAGNTRLHCFSGCSQADVLEAAGLKWKDLKLGGTLEPEILGKFADERKLQHLERKYGLMQWLASLERRQYWEAAMRRVLAVMEPLYWKVIPDKERFDRIREFEQKEYKNRRLDWQYRRQHGIDRAASSTGESSKEVRPESLHGVAH